MSCPFCDHCKRQEKLAKKPKVKLAKRDNVPTPTKKQIEAALEQARKWCKAMDKINKELTTLTWEDRKKRIK